MSGNLFYDKLQDLKYPKLSNYSPASFDWLFDNEDSLEFLTWFCQTVDSKNCVTQNELQRFENLKQEGKVLEGRLLKEALESHCGLDENIADVEESIRELEQKKKALSQQKELYTEFIQHYNLKQQHIDNAMSKTNDETELEAKVEQHLKSFFQECLKLNEVLSQIETSTTRLDEEIEKKLLCATSLNEFSKTEENLFETLVLFARKHFQELDEVCENPNNEKEQEITIFPGQNQKKRHVQNLVLCDLQEKLPKVIGENIYYQIESAANTKVFDTYQSILRDMSDRTFPSSSFEITQLSNILEKMIIDASEDIEFLKQETNASVEHLSDLKCSLVAVEDEKIRLLRQQHFMKQQQKFIQLQSQQWAREQLLLSALRFEKSVVENVLESWRALSATVAQSECLFKKYLPKMTEYNFAVEHSLDRTTIPRSDVLLLSMLELMSLGSLLAKQDGIYDYEDLVSMADNRSREHSSAISTFRDNITRTQYHIKQCKGYLNTMEGYCLHDCEIADFSQDLTTKLENLSNACNKFSLLLKPLQKNFRNKLNQSKAKGSKLQLENAWVAFYRQVQT